MQPERADIAYVTRDAHSLLSVVTQAELPRGDRQPGGDPEVRGGLRRGDQDARPRLQVLPGPGKGAIRTLLPSHETCDDPSSQKKLPKTSNILHILATKF